MAPRLERSAFAAVVTASPLAVGETLPQVSDETPDLMIDEVTSTRPASVAGVDRAEVARSSGVFNLGPMAARGLRGSPFDDAVDLASGCAARRTRVPEIRTWGGHRYPVVLLRPTLWTPIHVTKSRKL